MAILIEVQERKEKGKNEARRLRRSGLVPAVLYGASKEALSLTVTPADLDKILASEAGENSLLQLRLGGRERHAMIREIQCDPLTGRTIHADFVRIEMEKEIEVQVPVRTRGVAPGVKEQGGVLEVVHRTLQVQCLPANIPEHIDIAIQALRIGDHVRVQDLQVSGTYKVLETPDTVILTVLAPRAEEPAPGAAVAAEAAPTEPEVIAKGKKEAPEEAASPAPKKSS